MRRKSEKGKEKEKESPEKKTVRRTSRRHSKRRKHSRSSSPEPVGSDVEDRVTPRKSSKVKDSNDKLQDDKDGYNSTEISKTEKEEVVTSGENNFVAGEEDWREDTTFWSEGTSKDVPITDKAGESSVKLPALQEAMTTDNVQSVPEKGDVFTPKGKRPKRPRKRSSTGGCEDREPAADRPVCDDTVQSNNSTVSAFKKEIQSKSGSDNETELHSDKRNKDNSDNVEENSQSKENFTIDTEVKSNENKSEESSTVSRDTIEDISEINKPKVPLTPDSEESLVENMRTIKSEQEEGNMEKCSDSSCAMSEIEGGKILSVDVTEDISLKTEVEHPVNDSPSDQDNTRLGSDREASEESVAQDVCEGESNTSQASPELLSKTAAAPRRSRSSDSPDLQVRLEDTQDSLEELEKCISSDESKEKRKSPSDTKPAPSTKRRSMSDDSTKDAASNKEKHVSVFKMQKTSKHRERSREVDLSSHKGECDSDRIKHEVQKEKPKRIKLCRASRDSTNQSTSEKVSGSHSPEAKEHRRVPKLIRRSRSPGSSQKTRKSDGDAPEVSSPPYRHERILLRRSFPDKTVTRNEKASQEEIQTSTKADMKDKENGNLNASTGLSTAGSISRKRRWGASKTSRSNKKPVLSISSDSLKNLIPGAQPLPPGEVQLTEEDSSKEVKLELEESWSVKVEEKETVLMGPVVMFPEVTKVPPTDEHSRFSMRKISIVSDDARKLQRSPSPPKHRASNILFITNLVRPFTVNQLKELLARTGTIVEDGFWIDKIKSKCYVQYETEEQARDTRHALHGVRWPISNPKQLCVDFGEREAMEAAKIAGETDSIQRKVEPAQLERVPPETVSVPGANATLVEEWAAAQQARNKDRDKERDKARAKEKPGMPVAAAPATEQRIPKIPPAVREWDLGKLGQFSPEEEVRAEDRIKEKERKMRKDKLLRSRSTSPADLLARQKKRLIDGPPSRLLDDLFRKTKATPCIYWLPLTAEQIVVKEEIRRKHVAEHERRLAEMRKAERERERERTRAQQRPRRRSERDRERDRRSGRRRSGSGSPKK